jgi:hypothetical protein
MRSAQVLNDEVHARPYQTLHAPQSVSYLALLTQSAQRERDVVELCSRFGCDRRRRRRAISSPTAALPPALGATWRSQQLHHRQRTGGERFNRRSAPCRPMVAALSGSLMWGARRASPPPSRTDAISPCFSATRWQGPKSPTGRRYIRLSNSRAASAGSCCSILAQAPDVRPGAAAPTRDRDLSHVRASPCRLREVGTNSRRPRPISRHHRSCSGRIPPTSRRS